MNELPEHVRRNRAMWNQQARDYVAAAERAWSSSDPAWGIWHIPESELRLFPDDLAGRDAVELGCGTAYVSSWLKRRGARPVGIDISEAQLATAKRLQQTHRLDFPLIQASAESVPCADRSFDFAISEYGACLWADPKKWVPEAARLLRPGGGLVFLTNAFLLQLCVPEADGIPAGERLLRPAFGMYRVEYPSDPGVEFHLAHGEWIELLRACGFDVEALLELRPDERAATRYPFVTLEWARKWPCEEVWKARKRG